MGFAYKKISQSNISINPYKANKKFISNGILGLSDIGITLYIGENTPTSIINYFDPDRINVL